MNEDYFGALCGAVQSELLPAMPETRWVIRACQGGVNVECERVQGPRGVSCEDYDFETTVRQDHNAFDNARATAIGLLQDWMLLGLAGAFTPNAQSLFAAAAKAVLPATPAPEALDVACREAMTFYCTALGEPQDGRRLDVRFATTMALNPGFFREAVAWAIDELMGHALDEIVERWPL